MRKTKESSTSWLLPPLAAAAGLIGLIAVFFAEAHSFRRSVMDWAIRDLESRAELAASNLRDPLATGDFRAIHLFGNDCIANGVRLTIFSKPGGVVFDSLPDPASAPESVFVSRPCGEFFTVRLGLPYKRVLAPYLRARIGFIFAAAAGGAGVLLVAVFIFRQRMRMMKLAKERDAQRIMLEEMRKIEEFRKNFIADISHEIKTPLTGILGAADLLSSSENIPIESRARLVNMIKKESSRLNSLAHSIVSLARLESSEEAAINFTNVDLTGLLSEIADKFSDQAIAKGMELSIDTPDSCLCECDQELIESALSNLVSNALRHSLSRDIHISLAAKSNSVADICVEDHGIGIDSEHRTRIFDRFHRVDRSRSVDSGGSGLGLAIVRRIAELHGGSVSLAEAAPSGCKFVFSIPLRRQSSESSNRTDGDVSDSTLTESETR